VRTIGLIDMRKNWLSFHESGGTDSRFLFGFGDVSTYLGNTEID
jgi:hypothetical protein